jgi:hypothetical protein
MKVVKTRQEYRDARYELGFMRDGKPFPIPWPHRFNEVPPDDIWLGTEKFNEWLLEHSILPLEEADEEQV